ncbi:hypothetical protein GBW32_08580 [Streptomyces tsukubensis]|nr:hypothetical protein GBW32_08580 [Streptomyces tsukubensis]
MDPLDARRCPAVFFATMAAAPSLIVILHANRAGTINRHHAHGNGARRPARPSERCRASGPQALCPAHRPGIPPHHPRDRTVTAPVGAHLAIRVGCPAPARSPCASCAPTVPAVPVAPGVPEVPRGLGGTRRRGREKACGLRRARPVHWVQRKSEDGDE